MTSIPAFILQSDWKEALTGRDDSSVIWLRNFDEYEWRPTPANADDFSQNRTLLACNSIAPLWIADKNDVVVSRDKISPDLIRYIENVIGHIPEIISLSENSDFGLPCCKALLDNHDKLSAICRVADRYAYLIPCLTTPLIEKLSATTTLKILGCGTSTLFDMLDSKLTNRAIVRELGLREIPGIACDDIASLRSALLPPTSAPYPLLVKRASGCGGKGHAVIDDERSAQTYLATQGLFNASRTAYVVEKCIKIKQDYHYEFLLKKDSSIAMMMVIRLSDSTQFYHRIRETPHYLAETHYAEIGEASQKIGALLHEKGYVGFVGVDAAIDYDDTLYPVLEINPRPNAPTFFAKIWDKYPFTFKCCETYKLLRQATVYDFSVIRDMLDDMQKPTASTGGTIIHDIRPIKAAGWTSSDQRYGTELQIMTFAATATHLAQLRDAVSKRLAALENGESRHAR